MVPMLSMSILGINVLRIDDSEAAFYALTLWYSQDLRWLIRYYRTKIPSVPVARPCFQDAILC